MSIEFLKKAPKSASSGESDVRDKVRAMLDDIESGGEEAARRYTSNFDGWDGDILVSPEARAAAAKRVPQSIRNDIALPVSKCALLPAPKNHGYPMHKPNYTRE
jgi:sulfopropanediol 3-dehydrogenase